MSSHLSSVFCYPPLSHFLIFFSPFLSASALEPHCLCFTLIPHNFFFLSLLCCLILFLLYIFVFSPWTFALVTSHFIPLFASFYILLSFYFYPSPLTQLFPLFINHLNLHHTHCIHVTIHCHREYWSTRSPGPIFFHSWFTLL
jgi:hypothetical protein